MTAPAHTPLMTVDPATEEHVIFYNVSLTLRQNISLVNTSLWPLYQPTLHPHNFTFEEVTVLTSVGRSPVRPQMALNMLQTVVKTVDDFVMPAGLGIGILCSILLILTFMCTPLRASALSHYLTALGIADLLYLTFCAVHWTSQKSFDIYNKIGSCQITTFGLLLSRFLATWYLFAAHAERLVIHFGSCRARKWCTTFRTKCFIIGIFVFSLVGFSHYIWVYIVSELRGMVQCHLMEESIKFIMQLGKIEIITASFLPMFLIVVIDIALCSSVVAAYVKTLFNNAKTQRDKSWRGEYKLADTERSKSPSTRSGDSNPPPPKFDISLERTRATVLVVIAGIIFICLVLPSSIYRAKISFSMGSRPSMVEIHAMQIAEACVKFNSIYKLFLYVVTLKSFRYGLLHLFKTPFERRAVGEPLQETSV
ncbi:uncharacterized protein LOC131928742 [Physella acuta]|uniref:uncharacterized protein LOC131928742 n=1 Tax=Physella acuta TaxID=109671 RepID=UPI0027DE2705|nr:uncharacterized protein LOC131928742 [Physella acuta]